MIPPIILPLVRRAILDFVEDIGGELNDEALTIMLNGIGHRVARRDIANELRWLAERSLLEVEDLGPYLIVRSSIDGRDVARGLLRVDGVSRHKTDG